MEKRRLFIRHKKHGELEIHLSPQEVEKTQMLQIGFLQYSHNGYTHWLALDQIEDMSLQDEPNQKAEDQEQETQEGEA